ncbi:MAG: hypothetical protein IPN34_00400 [Planctomycetes bacterium]|nr:hypothetical protein [Planctomycetota bacterium]
MLAAGPSRVYRLRKFLRRYRLQVGAASLVLAVLCAGLVASSVYRRRAEDAAARAERALGAEQSARSDAELQFSRAVGAVDALLRRIADERLDGVPQAEPVRRAILGDAARFCDALLAQRGEDPRTLELSAATRLSLAELARQTQETEVAARECRLALELLEGPRAELVPRIARLHGRARAHFVLARLHELTLRADEVDRSFAAADGALAELLALEAAHEDGLRLRSELLVGRAGTLLQRESASTSDALAAARDALEDWRARGRAPLELQIQEIALASCAADHALAQGDLEAARAAVARGLAIWESAGSAEREHPSLRAACLDLGRSRGNVLLAEQRFEEALPVAQELVAVAEALAAQHPSVAHYRRSVGYGFGCLGVAYQNLRRWDEAQPHFRRAYEILNDPRNGDASQPAHRRNVGVYGTCYAGIVVARRDAAALEEALATIDIALEALEPERELASLRSYYLHALRLRVSLAEHLGRPADGLAAAEREAAALCAAIDLESASVEELARLGERLGRAAATAHFAGAAERAQRFLETAEPFVRKLEELAPGTPETQRIRGGLALPAGLLAASRGDAGAAWRATKTFVEQASTLGDDTRALALQLLLRTARCAEGKLRESCLDHVETWCRDELGAMETDPARFERVRDLPQVRRDFELCLGIERALRGDAEEALRCFASCLDGELELARSSVVWLLAQDRLALALELRAELSAERGERERRDEPSSPSPRSRCPSMPCARPSSLCASRHRPSRSSCSKRVPRVAPPSRAPPWRARRCDLSTATNASASCGTPCAEPHSTCDDWPRRSDAAPDATGPRWLLPGALGGGLSGGAHVRRPRPRGGAPGGAPRARDRGAHAARRSRAHGPPRGGAAVDRPLSRARAPRPRRDGRGLSRRAA